jgi:N-acetylglutamate synthase-like GNAT family acetyltransferase
MTVVVRKATSKDLPSIRELIKESFMAMSEEYGGTEATWYAHLPAADLLDENFEESYFSVDGAFFWVAEDSDASAVVGCVGLKRKSAEECTLQRMSVSATRRSSGVGLSLISALKAHCQKNKICRVLLTTGNSRAARFYGKCGFLLRTSFVHHLVTPEVTCDIKVVELVLYLGARIIRTVAVTGGTHGNEKLGIELVKHWQDDVNGRARELKRSTFECWSILSNLPAIAENKRFIDCDLNRQFPLPIDHLEALAASASAEEVSKETDEVASEHYSAARMNALLGPKTLHYLTPTKADFIVDLHSSTSSLGIMLILGCISSDNTGAGMAFDIKQRVTAEKSLRNGPLRVASNDVTKAEYYGLDR